MIDILGESFINPYTSYIGIIAIPFLCCILLWGKIPVMLKGSIYVVFAAQCLCVLNWKFGFIFFIVCGGFITILEVCKQQHKMNIS